MEIEQMTPAGLGFEINPYLLDTMQAKLIYQSKDNFLFYSSCHIAEKLQVAYNV